MRLMPTLATLPAKRLAIRKPMVPVAIALISPSNRADPKTMLRILLMGVIVSQDKDLTNVVRLGYEGTPSMDQVVPLAPCCSKWMIASVQSVYNLASKSSRCSSCFSFSN